MDKTRGKFGKKPGQEHRINQDIRCEKVRLITDDGEQLGIVEVEEALKRAEVAQLDLVEVAPLAKPPVCKIMDYGHFKYEQVKKLKEAKKKNRSLALKEVKLSLNIDENDLNTKVKAIKAFIEKGHKVKVTLRLRGREASYASFGFDTMRKVQATLDETEVVLDSPPAMAGPKNIIMILAPKSKK